jgi:FYVE zinc finger
VQSAIHAQQETLNVQQTLDDKIKEFGAKIKELQCENQRMTETVQMLEQKQQSASVTADANANANANANADVDADADSATVTRKFVLELPVLALSKFDDETKERVKQLKIVFENQWKMVLESLQPHITESTRTAPQPAWVADTEAHSCMSCRRAFSFFNRRHHCRQCGGVFDSDCCRNRDKPDVQIFGHPRGVRICNSCYHCMLYLSAESKDPLVSLSPASRRVVKTVRQVTSQQSRTPPSPPTPAPADGGSTSQPPPRRPHTSTS